MAGRLIPQTADSALADVSTVFNNFIHGQDSNITVQGDSVGPAEATWLNEGIKALQVQTVLPNRGVLSIIKSINLNELDLRFTTSTAFAPSSGSDDTTAAFTLPFALDAAGRLAERLSKESKSHVPIPRPCLRCKVRGRNRTCSYHLCQHCCKIVEEDGVVFLCRIDEHNIKSALVYLPTTVVFSISSIATYTCRRSSQCMP